MRGSWSSRTAVSTEIEPVPNNWYRHLDKGQTFVVIEVDEHDGIVEIQHYDGDLEQIELAVWNEMDLELAEEPEDWTGPVDDVETDDLDYTETDMSAEDWRGSLRDTHAPEGESWEETTPEDERDDWGEGTAVEDGDQEDRVPD